VTGKPAGDDLREGKRTVLVALARTGMPGNAVRLFDELLGDPELTDSQITMLQSTIVNSGAVEKVERMIAKNVNACKGRGNGREKKCKQCPRPAENGSRN
jgi:geranylgeranyl diphosphate synthase type I